MPQCERRPPRPRSLRWIRTATGVADAPEGAPADRHHSPPRSRKLEYEPVRRPQGHMQERFCHGCGSRGKFRKEIALGKTEILNLNSHTKTHDPKIWPL